jgi:hypothetical protein
MIDDYLKCFVDFFNEGHTLYAESYKNLIVAELLDEAGYKFVDGKIVEKSED